MKFVRIPSTITYKDITSKNSLSPTDFKTTVLKNKNQKRIRALISNEPQKGREVGSFSYIRKSKFYFMRTKALQESGFLPLLDDSESIIPIMPSSFNSSNLCNGDVLLSKDANIGEIAYLDRDLPNIMISSGLFKLRFQEKMRYYIIAFMKSDFFKSQILSKGLTIKHAKKRWLDAIIPFPHQDDGDDITTHVSLLTKGIIRKESKIIENSKKIDEIISNELKENPADHDFNYTLPTEGEVKIAKRLDTALYTEDYKKKIFLIKNYSAGSDDIYGWGFKLSRGQNLQISAIGKSIYSEYRKSNFYRLYLPKHITSFGTISKTLYLGNKNKLKCIENGDILFGAEGFEKGRSIVMTKDMLPAITNIHGITLKSNKKDFITSVYIRCFLNYLRNEGLIDKFAVGGNGGSLAQRYWKTIHFPKFSISKQKEIAKLYYNPTKYKNNLNLKTFEGEDIEITKESGILQLDRQIKLMRQKLDETMIKIINGETLEIDFKFLIT